MNFKFLENVDTDNCSESMFDKSSKLAVISTDDSLPEAGYVSTRKTSTEEDEQWEDDNPLLEAGDVSTRKTSTEEDEQWENAACSSTESTHIAVLKTQGNTKPLRQFCGK